MTQPDYRKMRQQARLLVANVGVSLFLKAQDHQCSICGERLSAKKLTVDHVHSLSFRPQPKNAGNLLLCHYECNQSKSDSFPSERELAMLARVNTQLGFDPTTDRYRCRQDMINRYFRLTLWLHELNVRDSDKAMIKSVQNKIAILEPQVSEWIDL